MPGINNFSLKQSIGITFFHKLLKFAVNKTFQFDLISEINFQFLLTRKRYLFSMNH